MFKQNLKKIRISKGFSQEQLSVRLNVVRQTISKWEKGLSVPDAEMLVQLAEVLQVSVSDLLGKNIETEKPNAIDNISIELSKLNELLANEQFKGKQMWKKIKNIVIVIIFVVFICAIFDKWNSIFHDFGKNLYYMFH